MKKLFVFLLFVIPFSVNSENFNLEKLVLLSHTNLTDKPADIFYVGSSVNESNYCSITATKDYIAATNGHLRKKSRDQPEFNMDCNWNGIYFVDSTNHKTMADVVLVKSNESGLTSITIQATLVSLKGEFADFNGKISNIQYELPEAK